MRTIFAVIPVAQAAATAVTAFQALPRSDGSRLVGLHVSPLTISYGFAGEVGLASYIEAQIAAADQEREEAEAAFAEACRQSDISYEWRAERSPDAIVSAHAGSAARAADVVLAPQFADDASLGRHQLEELVFASGRPVLALPKDWEATPLAARILLAWDGGREATRAVFDALPLLMHAEAVKIVSVQGFLDDPVRQFTPGDDIATTLARHRAPVETASFRGSRRSVAEELEAQAFDFGATLIVMGCYGHSRFRERVLGGVSRGMLAKVPFPLLLSN